MRKSAAVIGFASVVLLLAACGDDGGPPPNYLALGDSLAVGVGATDAATGGYVPRFHAYLQSEDGLDTEVVLNNLAVSGETSDSFITDGQLEAALAELTAGEVGVVTLDIGGNDALDFLDAPEFEVCYPDLDQTACFTAFGEALERFGDNFATILDRLRAAAGADTLIIVMTYFNPLLGSGCAPGDLRTLSNIGLEGLPGTLIEEGINDIIRRVAAEHDAKVAELIPDSSPLLGLQQIAADCIHANDTGHEVIAGAFIDAFEG
jgi:lysophospholipase L1-like esterase